MNKAVAIHGLATFVLSAAVVSAAAEPGHYRRKAESGQEAVVGVGVRYNKACQGTGVPEVSLDAAPEHGFVCARIGPVRPRNLIFGSGKHCFHKLMTGLQIVYQSRLDFSGMDAVGYTLKFPRGNRALVVDIQVKPVVGAASKQANPLFERQPTGRMPDCVALVS